ncbi:putative endonuclease lcl3, partial [Irineochytrium annulatum]
MAPIVLPHYVVRFFEDIYLAIMKKLSNLESENLARWTSNLRNALDNKSLRIAGWTLDSRTLMDHPFVVVFILLILVLLTKTLISAFRHYLTFKPLTADAIPHRWFERRKRVYARVVKVGDADGIRVVIHPLPTTLMRTTFRDSISIRLAGVDAPECAHFGEPGQKGGAEAKAWLTRKLLARDVFITFMRRDKYDRAVAVVELPSQWSCCWLCHCLPGGWGCMNVSVEMLRLGLATVYRGADGEYGRDNEKARARFERVETGARAR